MDLNHEYAAHQRALVLASRAGSEDARRLHLETASSIACRISAFQLKLGAGAACAWSHACLARPRAN